MFNGQDVHVAWHKVYGDNVPSLVSMNIQDIVEVANAQTHRTAAEQLFHAITTTFVEPGPQLRCASCLYDSYPCDRH